MNIDEFRLEFRAALDDYFQISEVLRSDIDFMLSIRDDSSNWRRAFIRSAIPLAEGYCYYFRRFGEAYIGTGNELPKKQMSAIKNESRESAADRIKLNIKTGYEMFGLTPRPNFQENGWAQAKKAIALRDRLMHPNHAHEMKIDNHLWNEVYDGILWLLAKIFGVIDGMFEKYGNDN